MVGPAAKREGVAHLQAVMGLSERRACNIVNADRKMVRYQSRRPPDTELRDQLRDLAKWSVSTIRFPEKPSKDRTLGAAFFERGGTGQPSRVMIGPEWRLRHNAEFSE
jgi:hypothetical protein